MNHVMEDHGSDRRLLVPGGSRLQTRTRTRRIERLKPRHAMRAGAVGVVVALVGLAGSASAHATTSAAGQTVGAHPTSAATECWSAAKNSPEADGCFKNTSGTDDPFRGGNDPRLGPALLPTTGPEGSVLAAVAKITAHYRRFGDLTETRFLKMYWSFFPVFGPGWIYPPYGGFDLGSNGLPIYERVHLKVGDLVDRFGGTGGTYLSPVETPYADRALPPSNLDWSSKLEKADYNYHEYRIDKAFMVDAGKIAAWFGQKGGGTQYATCDATVTENGIDCMKREDGKPVIGTDGKPVTENVQYLLENNYLTQVTP